MALPTAGSAPARRLQGRRHGLHRDHLPERAGPA